MGIEYDNRGTNKYPSRASGGLTWMVRNASNRIVSVLSGNTYKRIIEPLHDHRDGITTEGRIKLIIKWEGFFNENFIWLEDEACTPLDRLIRSEVERIKSNDKAIWPDRSRGLPMDIEIDLLGGFEQFKYLVSNFLNVQFNLGLDGMKSNHSLDPKTIATQLTEKTEENKQLAYVDGRVIIAEAVIDEGNIDKPHLQVGALHFGIFMNNPGNRSHIHHINIAGTARSVPCISDDRLAPGIYMSGRLDGETVHISPNEEGIYDSKVLEQHGIFVSRDLALKSCNTERAQQAEAEREELQKKMVLLEKSLKVRDDEIVKLDVANHKLREEALIRTREHERSVERIKSAMRPYDGKGKTTIEKTTSTLDKVKGFFKSMVPLIMTLFGVPITLPW